MFPISKLKEEYHFWDAIGAMIDQCIDIALNLAQSGHPGGSRSKMPVLLTTLLSGAMRWDIRNPGKTFGDRFILVAGHTNPLVYATLAVFNEALSRKYQETGDKKYHNPLGNDFTLTWTDLLTLRRKNGLPGHAEMEGKTLFFKYNTGPTGHGSAPAVGQALAMKYVGAEDVKIFALEGEGGLTTGISHEARISAFGMGVGNLVYIVDWNDFGIDARPFSDIMSGTPKEWFEPYGWKVAGTENGEDWESILNAYTELFDQENLNQPKALWVRTRKGRGYQKFDDSSHGSPHKQNSKQFWDIRREFAEKYGIIFKYMDAPSSDDITKNIRQMKSALESVMSLFDSIDGLTDYLACRLIELAESIPEHENIKSDFRDNPMDDPTIYEFENYPASLYRQPGEIAPNREAFGNFGSWLNSYSREKYGRPLALVCSADLAGSTNIAGFCKGWLDSEDFGMYHRENNKAGTLFPQGITEFANAGMMTGISSVNFDDNPYLNFSGFITACSTYGSFSYLKYGAYRLYSQIAQDSQLMVGKTIWVAGHSGPETAEDFRTHFGIFAPGVTQLFPEGHIINLHPWEYNEVPVMLGAALKTNIPIVALHLTRPSIVIPDREELGMESHFKAARGAYIIKDYDNDNMKEGVVLVRGTSVISELSKILPKINSDGPNIKIIAALSWGLYSMQSEEYKLTLIKADEWLDCMIITNTSLQNMSNWIQHPIVREYSLSADWDNKWRHGGNLEEVIEEAHLSSSWQKKAILRFADERDLRIKALQKRIPSYLLEKLEIG